MKTNISFLYITAIVMIASTGCKKMVESIARNQAEAYFEDNIMGKDFKVLSAMNDTTDLTSLYEGFTFRLYKTTYYNGPMIATRNGVTYNGTWQCTEDYGKLTIQIDHPDPQVSGFYFLNRSWRFVRKIVPLLELAPWGTTQPHKLYMLRI
jgi:hypothetical protein